MCFLDQILVFTCWGSRDQCLHPPFSAGQLPSTDLQLPSLSTCMIFSLHLLSFRAEIAEIPWIIRILLRNTTAGMCPSLCVEGKKREIYLMELSHVIVGISKSKICRLKPEEKLVTGTWAKRQNSFFVRDLCHFTDGKMPTCLGQGNLLHSKDFNVGPISKNTNIWLVLTKCLNHMT